MSRVDPPRLGPDAAPWVHLPGHVAHDELERLSAGVARCMGLFRTTGGRSSLGPRYGVIPANVIARQLPEVTRFGHDVVQPLLERVCGERVRPLRSERRAVRVQCYEGRDAGFRWHRDGHTYVALVTLENDNRGETQILSRAWSRRLKYALYAAYPLPGLFSLLPRQSVTMAPGDVLLMRGREVIHRGVTLSPDGKRVLLAYCFDEWWREPRLISELVASVINY
ncbi:MAG: hypothetical protein AB2A00_03000 [Myxococcota bacterium]